MQTLPEQIAHLRQQIEAHDYAYYVLDNPSVSDAQYDALYRQLIELERAHPACVTPDSPSQRVGGKVMAGFQAVRHQVAMLSLDNAFSDDELAEFDQRIQKRLQEAAIQVEALDYAAEPKMDGLAVNLRYEQGRLVQAATRG
jgi:DNA ligase (NAD+)